MTANAEPERSPSGELHSPPDPSSQPGLHEHLAIAGVSAAILLYEIVVTRVLSVALWYHFAFLAISLAMLSVGAPGVWFFVKPPTERTLARCLAAGAISVPLSVIVLIHAGRLVAGQASLGLVDGGANVVPALLAALAIVGGMLPLGAAVCVLLLRARGRGFGRMYGADLLGATVGALVVVPLLFSVPAPQLLALLGVLPAAAWLLLDRSWRAGLLLVAVVVVASVPSLWQLDFNKRGAEGEPLFERWSPTARVTVWPAPPDEQVFVWGNDQQLTSSKPVEARLLLLDSAAATRIVKLDETTTVADLDHLDHDVAGVGYLLRPPKSVAIVGAGGGHDLLFALRAGAERVLALELNDAVHEAMTGPFFEFSGGLYRRPQVEVVLGEGRSTLTRLDEEFDILQISLIDTWAATTSGAFALSENHLYTLEAFDLYLDRLSPRGVLSVSRHARGPNRLEGGRLVNLARQALANRGVADPRRHILVMVGGYMGTVLVSKTAWTEAELRRVDELGQTLGFARVWPAPPGARPSFLGMLLASNVPIVEPFAGVDLAPPTDDSPFYFQTFSVFRPVDDDVIASSSFNEHAVLMLRWLIAAVVLLSLFVFVVPLVIRRTRGSAKHPAASGPGGAAVRSGIYFAGIGLGFMWIETAWVQRFMLFLGHPSYGTTVAVATMLAGAGLGSVLAQRIPASKRRGLVLAIAVCSGVVTLVLPGVFAVGLALPLAARVVVSVLLLSGPAILMGFGFPLGVHVFGDRDKAWFWAINGVTSVSASVLSIALAIDLGFTSVALLGAAAYMVAAGALGRPDATLDRATS